MRSTVFILVSLVLFSGCEKYRAKPLNTEHILVDVERKRQLINDSDYLTTPLTFSRLKELTQSHSPILNELDAEYRSRLAVAKIKTPLPNPAFEAGPEYAFGPDASKLYRLQPFASIGFTIPTGGRLKRQDELNQLLYEQALAEWTIRYREVYLDLRQKYAEGIWAQSRLALRLQLSESASQTTTLSRKLIESGHASVLDAGLIELEQARLKTDEFQAAAEKENAISEMAALTGLSAAILEKMTSSNVPEQPANTPSLEELKNILLLNHPELARLRLQYEVSERTLRLEIARQYPDFQFGPSFARETGEKKSSIGLTLGIELPLFDRNQQGVAKAKQDREASRVRFESAANRALAELERTFRLYSIYRSKLTVIKSTLVPIATKNVETAKKSLEAGSRIH
ncbi:TolC family protein [Oscillatoria laete-virens NRMC-F 0139]|nr:TolC family protein [Oscillatoria laete-virens NRMC-F 0139]